MSTVAARTIAVVVFLVLASMAPAAPATQPATPPPAALPAAATTAPASQPGGFLAFQPLPTPARSDANEYQGIGSMKPPASRPAFCKSERAQVWRQDTSRFLSALLFDESGGTGTGFDTLYVSFDGDETFSGEVEKYKPSATDVSPEALGRNFEMTFLDVKIQTRPGMPAGLCKVRFTGSRDQKDPASKFTFGGRIYPPKQGPRQWAVGTLTIDGKQFRAALVDENTNGRFTDRGGLNPKNPENRARGDVLLLAMDEKEKLDAHSYGQGYAPHIPLTEYLVLNSGTYQVKVAQSDDGVSVGLVPARLPAGTVEPDTDRGIDRIELCGTKTYVLLIDPPGKIFLPADTYLRYFSGMPYSGETPYELEAEEGLTAGAPFPKEAETSIAVLLPDGSPAGGAEYVVTRGRGVVFVENGRVDARMAKPSKADEDGRMSVRRLSEGSEVVVVHDGGWAHVAAKDVLAKKQITLSAWGSVEGTLRIGGKVGANEKVHLDRTMFLDPGKSPQVSFWYRTTTDDAGHFSLPRMITGHVQAGWTRTGNNRSTYSTSQTYVTVDPGKTATVTIGGVGRPVIGRVEVPEDVKGRLATAWINGNVSIRDSAWETMKLPPDWMEMSREQQQKWRQDYLKEHKAEIEKQATRVYTSYSFQVEPDGSFRIEDVTTGKYRWHLAIQDPQSRGPADILCWANVDLDVPKMETERSDEPLDLGAIPMRVPQRAAIGKPFPLPEVKDLEGKPLKTSDFAGRHVLVYLHDMSDASKWVPQLKAIDKEFGGKRLTVVGLYYESRPPEDFAAYAAGKGMDWPQAFVTYYDLLGLYETWQDTNGGTAFLVGPDGTLLARQARLDEMRKTVAGALAGKIEASATSPAAKAAAAPGEMVATVATEPTPAEDAPGPESQAVIHAARAFWQAVGAGQDDQAAALATETYVKGHPQAFPRLREAVDPSAARIAEVAAASDSAIALTAPLTFKNGRKGSLGMGLVRQGGEWLIRDLDFLPHEQARSKFVDDFRAHAPDASALLPVPADAGGGASTAQENAAVASRSPGAVDTPTPKAPISGFAYIVPDIAADAKINLVFRKFPVEFSEEQCDQRIVPWEAASPKPAFCKSDKALLFDVQRRHIFEARMVLDESAGTGTGYDTLYVDPAFEGDFGAATVYKASKFAGTTGVEGGKVIAWFENVVVKVGRLEGYSTAHIQVFLQEPRPGTTDAGVLEGWAIPQNWAVGTASIGGRTYPAAMLDRNWNDRLTDRAGFLQEQYPAMLARGDYLILGKPGTRTLVAGGTLGEGGSVRVIRTDTIVLGPDIYKTAVEPADDGVSLRFQPAEVPTGKVQLKRAPGDRLVLLGAKTSAILGGSSTEAVLPVDTYLALVDLQEPPTVLEVNVNTSAGMAAAPFELKALDGKPLKLADYRGRHVLLTFWACWARPCLADIPHLKAVHEQYGKGGKVIVIGLSMDDDADTTRDYLRRNPLPWPQAFLEDAQRADIAVAYAVDRVPATFLIDPQGRIAASGLHGPAIEQAVARAVAGTGMGPTAGQQ